MAIKKFKPMTPGTRFRSIVDNSDILTKKAPERSLLEGASKSGVATTTVVLLPVGAGVDTSDGTAVSTFAETSSAFPGKLPRSSTIRIVARTSPLSTMRTARSDTFFIPEDWKSVRPSYQARMPTFGSATRFR